MNGKRVEKNLLYKKTFMERRTLEGPHAKNLS
jgi:hypothetical protein